ncbi:MAG TPA: C25 family cysteine peptidase, partial [Candidatus Limnocylindrales bacterium]|nr:C25 family cysteine peptidase [Candidatus Limnocylindrales bacterium]
MSLLTRPLTILVLLTALPGVAPGEDLARVESVTATGYRAVVSIPEPEVLVQQVFGENLAEISLPGGSFDSPAGTPMLPTLTVLLRVPWGVDPVVRATPGQERVLGAMRPVPLPHLISNRAMWATLTADEVAAYLEGPAYGRWSGAPAPALAPLATSVNAAAGGERIVQVTLRPVRYDPRTGLASALDQVTLDVAWEKPVVAAAAGGGNAVGPRYAQRTGLTPIAGRSRVRASAYTGPLRVEPTRSWVRLGVLRPGLYAVSPADLVTAGVVTAGIDPSSLRLFRATPGDLPESVAVDLGPDSLRECAIVVTGEGDGVFNAGDRIYFYATGNTGFGHDLMLGGSPDYQEAQRSDEESLWLTWGAGPLPTPPRRMATRDAAPLSAASSLTSVPHRVHYEENRVRDFGLFDPNLRWERWFYRLFTQGSRIAFLLTLPGAEPGGTASLAVRMWGKGISRGATVADHYVNVYWDRTLVAADTMNFSRARDLFASGFTVNATDTLEVQVPRVVDPSDPNRFDQSDLAWFEVTYPRRLAAINDTLQFAADSIPAGPVHYVVDGITDTTAVWFLERSDPENPVRYVNGAVLGAAPPFTLTLEDTVGTGGPPKRYALVSTARAARPTTVARYAPAATAHAIENLLDPLPPGGVDYLIVAHPSLIASAESLATFREGRLNGFAAPRVAIATTDRIAAQLGAGYLDPVAIRNLLAYARLHWAAPAPTYVCLFGDASLDPKNYLGFNTPDLVPTYANYYDVSILAQYVSDDFLGFLDGPGDQLLDIAIGRLPAKSTVEAAALAGAKLRAYETSSEFDPWRARALLSADDAWKRDILDDLGNLHVIEMERKDRFHLPYPIERSKVYLNDYPFPDTLHQSKPAAREDFIARINQGNWLVDYIGHGSDIVIADEQLFRSNDVGRLTNGTRPSIFGLFSCTVGKFDALGQEGLGELLLKTPGAGAIASIAATEKVFPVESTD